MKLYHGTCEKNAKDILKNGLISRQWRETDGNWFDNCKSVDNLVYLTKNNINCWFYSLKSALISEDEKDIGEV